MKAQKRTMMLCLGIIVSVLISLFPNSEGCWANDGNMNSQFHLNIHKVSHYSFPPGNPRWPTPSKYNLTYSFPNGFPSNGIPVMAQAFNEWAAQNPLQIYSGWFSLVHIGRGGTNTDSRDRTCDAGVLNNETIAPLTHSVANNAVSDLKISFQRGSHGDGAPFDGQGGTLAHAFSPRNGWFHLDADDRFSVGNPVPTEFDLKTVSIHEIGHLLGLGHSNDQQAVMYPFIKSGTVNAIPQPDDVNGIKALYGY